MLCTIYYFDIYTMGKGKHKVTGVPESKTPFWRSNKKFKKIKIILYFIRWLMWRNTDLENFSNYRFLTVADIYFLLKAYVIWQCKVYGIFCMQCRIQRTKTVIKLLTTGNHSWHVVCPWYFLIFSILMLIRSYMYISCVQNQGVKISFFENK